MLEGSSKRHASVNEHDDVTDDDDLCVCVGRLVKFLLETNLSIERQAKATLLGFLLDLEESVAEGVFPINSPCKGISSLLSVVNNPGHSDSMGVNHIVVVTTKDHVGLDGLPKVWSTIHGALGACAEVLFPILGVKSTLGVPVS